LKDLKKDLGDSATILILHGNLGAGKTAFVQKLGKILGVKKVITSPTFVILKEYKTQDNIFKRLIHIDAYRMESMADLKFSLDPFMKDKSNLLCIEWAENIKEALPQKRTEIQIKKKSNDFREIEILK
jgi:tRNA threonylcarbamoyladenosine biosynthesis protein TsaE